MILYLKLDVCILEAVHVLEQTTVAKDTLSPVRESKPKCKPSNNEMAPLLPRTSVSLGSTEHDSMTGRLGQAAKGFCTFRVYFL